MIPPFDEHGYLPTGIHKATIEEVAERFGLRSQIRRDQMESLRWLIDLARRTGAERLILNGSCVTGTVEPNDVDCALLVGPGFPKDRAAEAILRNGLPFLEIDLVRGAEFEFLVERFFATDRKYRPKGMIEVLL